MASRLLTVITPKGEDLSLEGYDKVLRAIDQFRNEEMDFREFRGWVVPYASSMQEELGFEGRDFDNTLDNWFEYIEYCYWESDRQELTLSIASFLEAIIKNEPRPICLPKEDRVVKDQKL